jgi:hypothetical protein
MASYFDKKKKQKLYRQWVEKSGLPPESVPAETAPEGGPDEAPEEDFRPRRSGILRDVSITLTMRHILYLLLIIIVLLISTAVLATVLVMRSG